MSFSNKGNINPEEWLKKEASWQLGKIIDALNAAHTMPFHCSWLERDFKINEAIEMLEKAYKQQNDDPYIIDSIGWAYYLTNDYIKAEKFLIRAVQLMPDDPIVNDHYGDILWKLDRKIQARYFWTMVLKMEDAEKDLLDQIKNKLIKGL